LRGDLPANDYIDALLADIGAIEDSLAGRYLTSIFLGGGTPSLFSANEMDRLISAVANRFSFSQDIEITMEANPGAVGHGQFASYRKAGINRLSLGVQSFSDVKLTALGRIHDAQDARRAFDEARAAGYANINLDLMFALPEQSLEEAQEDVATAIALEPEHISYYHLTLEPNTVFYSRPPVLPDSDASWEIQHMGASCLADAGFGNYEVSAWSKPGEMCRHNMNYWRYGDYLGIGAGAHGKYTLPDGSVFREVRAAHPREYLAKVRSGQHVISRTRVEAGDLVFEYMLNALRLKEGFAIADFESMTGLEKSWIEEGVSLAKQKQLLSEPRPGHLQPSVQGWRFLDDLQAIFLPADTR